MNGNGMTLELDDATATVVERLAAAWGVSKEEAIRRAVSSASTPTPEPARLGRMEAFKELQHRLKLSPERAVLWQTAVREARR